MSHRDHQPTLRALRIPSRRGEEPVEEPTRPFVRVEEKGSAARVSSEEERPRVHVTSPRVRILAV